MGGPLISMTGILIRSKQTQRQAACRENTWGSQAETGVMGPQAEHCLGPPKPGKGLEGPSPLEASEEAQAALPTP